MDSTLICYAKETAVFLSAVETPAYFPPCLSRGRRRQQNEGGPVAGSPIYQNLLGKPQAEVTKALKSAIKDSQRLDMSQVKARSVESEIKL